MKINMPELETGKPTLGQRPDVTVRMKAAMEGESITAKNIALFDALREIENLRSKTNAGSDT